MEYTVAEVRIAAELWRPVAEAERAAARDVLNDLSGRRARIVEATSQAGMLLELKLSYEPVKNAIRTHGEAARSLMPFAYWLRMTQEAAIAAMDERLRPARERVLAELDAMTDCLLGGMAWSGRETD